MKNHNIEYQQFINFLKKNNVYDKYTYNFNKHDVNDFMIDICYLRGIYKITSISCLFEYTVVDMILEAFKWNQTTEGECFWLKIHKKWLDFIDMITKQ